MNEVTVRMAAPGQGDVQRIGSLFDQYRQFYDQPADSRLAESFIRDRLAAGESIIFLAESNGANSPRALGFVQLYPSFSSVAARRILVLNDLFVVPEARRLGVGRALLEAARRHAVETGAKRLTLETMADNHTAQRLYESLGYVCENDIVKFYSLELE